MIEAQRMTEYLEINDCVPWFLLVLNSRINDDCLRTIVLLDGVALVEGP